MGSFRVVFRQFSGSFMYVFTLIFVCFVKFRKYKNSYKPIPMTDIIL